MIRLNPVAPNSRTTDFFTNIWDIMGIFSWALFGLLAGALARWIYPGRQGYGIFKTMVIGILGGLLGGWAGSMFFGVGVLGFDWRSLLVAVLGAMFVIWIWERIRK